MARAVYCSPCSLSSEYSSDRSDRCSALDVGVHTRGVRVEVAAGRGREQRQLLLSHPPPTERADVGVGLQLRLAEEF